MKERNLIASLDVGTTKSCCIIADISEDERIKVVGVGVADFCGLRKGLVADIEQTTKSISEAVSKARRRAGDIKISSATLGITGEHITSMNSRAAVAITSHTGEITQHDVDRVVETSKSIVLPNERTIVQAIPRQYMIDGLDGIKFPVGMYGSRLEIETHIVTASISFVNNLIKAAENAYVAIDSCILGPTATAEAVLEDDEKNLGVIVIDIGGGTSDVAVFKDGEVFYTSSIAIAGTTVTDDITYVTKLVKDEAERQKRDLGAFFVADYDEEEKDEDYSENDPHLQKHLISSIIEARMKELFELIKKDVKKADCYDVLTGVVITGGGSLLNGADKIAKRVFGLPVRIGYPKTIDGLPQDMKDPRFATAIGLVLCRSRSIKNSQRTNSGVDFAKTLFEVFSGWIRKLFRPGA